MRFLNSRERKTFFATLKKQYGYNGSKDFVVFEKAKDKYYFATTALAEIDIELIRPAHAGLYVINDMHGELRLSMDGAQLLGPDCTHETITLTQEQRDCWMRGEDVQIDQEDVPFSIVVCEKDILGCGKIKDGYLLNYVPKGRWILDPH